MIQAIGLTSAPRRGRPPAVDDLTFEARPGMVTALLGPSGAGKSTALRLMLQLSPGRGVTLFRGRPLSRVPHPPREIGILLGDVPGHPRRTARSHLRMLAAADGVPSSRADDMLDVVGLSGLADQRLGRFSRGMDRRLGLGVALLGDPHTLVLDEPTRGLSLRETAWLHGLLRGYAQQGGAVLVTARDPKETARFADRVVTVDKGRLIADQDIDDFARARLRPRVAVHTPHADRLAAALVQAFRGVRATSDSGPVEVVRQAGGRLAVFGSTCSAVGEVAYRHRVVVHRLADEVGDAGDGAAAGPLHRADGRVPSPQRAQEAVERGSGEERERRSVTGLRRSGRSADRRPAYAALPPRLPAVPPPGPSWPLRYELRRLTGVPTSWWVVALALIASLVASAVLASAGAVPGHRVLTGWPERLPLPPTALAAGLLGAMAFGQEFRYPALVPAQVPVPRRLSLLTGKLAVSGAAALLLCCAAVTVNTVALMLLYGRPEPTVASLGAAVHGIAALCVGCAWAGLLAAGVMGSTLAGLVAVAAVPLALAPALRALLAGPMAQPLDGLLARLRALTTLLLPSGVDRWVSASVQPAPQLVGWALVVSLTVLLCGYALLSLRGSAR